MTQRAVAFVAGFLLPTLGLAGCGTSGASVESRSVHPAPSAQVIAELRSTVITYAAEMGDADPTDLRYYATDLGSVLQAEGGTKRSDNPATPVYVLVAHGSFTSSRSRPPGSRPPTGRALMVALDAATLHQVELSLGPTDIDLSKFGPEHDF